MITALILWIHAHESWVMLVALAGIVGNILGRGAHGRWRDWREL